MIIRYYNFYGQQTSVITTLTYMQKKKDSPEWIKSKKATINSINKKR